MEIEKKYLIEFDKVPKNINQYPSDQLEQAYIITHPVLRIRKKNETYVLTYKGSGLMMREESEFPLPKDAYEKLLLKTDGNIISKTRYRIPEKNNLTIELDLFSGIFKGLILAEVEFPDEKSAQSYQPPTWFGPDVTNLKTFQNSTLSELNSQQVEQFLSSLSTYY